MSYFTVWFYGAGQLTSYLFGRLSAINGHGHCCVAWWRLLVLLHGQPWLGGARLLWQLVAWGVAMRQQPIQHQWQGCSRAARWKEACEVKAYEAALSAWQAPCPALPLPLQRAHMQMPCIAFTPPLARAPS